MQVEFKRIKQTLVAGLQGEMDLTGADALKKQLDHYIEQEHIRRLVLNLEQVTFLDSSGLGIIIGRYKKMAAHHGKMYIVGAKPPVEKILVFSGINQIIPLYRSEHEITDI
jgi:stage II sporulation protein AA (anti-sigma F factor antagonist)